jgi:hypothetical protein
MTDIWEYWKSEIVRTEQGGEPNDPHRQEVSEITGYWRVLAAKTKVDWPVLVWHSDNGYLIQWGGARPKPMSTAEVDDFRAGTFLKCAAVRKAAWEQAIFSKQWPDGKVSLPQTAEERHDVIPATPVEEGGNMILDEDTGEPVDDYWLQIKTKLGALAEKAGALGRIVMVKGKPVMQIADLATAEKAAKLRDDIREVGGMGEARRKEEKKPHDDAAKAVQDKWVPVLAPASEVATAILNGIDAFQLAEKRRLEDEERQRREAERKRLAEEEAARLRAEAEARAAEAAERGADVPVIDDEQIAAEAAERAAEQVDAEPIEVSKPVVQGSAYSRAASKARQRSARIVDVKALVLHLVEADDADLLDYLQKRANAAARAKITLPGTEVDE